MKLKPFLDKYDTVIFDMDGVITSEQSYWDSAALTVWEYLKFNRNEEIDTGVDYKEVRRNVFCNDELIDILKCKGVNSNWDLGYVTVLMAWICCGVDNETDFQKALEYAKKLPENIIEAYDLLAEECSKATGFDLDWLKRNGVMWKTMQMIFQEWYLGDELYRKRYNVLPKISGKSGQIFKETPLLPIEPLREMLKLLSENKRLCVGTGRISDEITQPLADWGIDTYFSKNGMSTFDLVETAERNTGLTLTKPSPYVFLKALYGTDCGDEEIIKKTSEDEKISRTLIVGDAGADILAAKAMGADFCAVLTGVQGERARPYFEKLNAEYILNSVLEFTE